MNTSKKYYTTDWPRNNNYSSRINVIEFYHKILWDSQRNCDSKTEDCNKIKRRVRFSQEPPEVFEYEPEETKCSHFFDYRSLACRQQKLKFNIKEKYPHKEIALTKDISHTQSYKTLRTNTRSISDFRPIINDQFKDPSYSTNAFNSSRGFVFSTDNASSLSIAPQEPPPSYKRYDRTSSYNEKAQNERAFDLQTTSNQFMLKGKMNSSSLVTNTLRKIKSSPRLLLQRKPSVVTLRKKVLF